MSSNTLRDYVEVHDLLVRTVIGVTEWERRDRQDVVLNLRLYVDARPAGRSDEIDDALNYRTVTKAVIDLAKGNGYRLVEALAEAIARLCVVEFGVAKVRVRVEKPGALRFARSVSLTVERTAEDYASD